MHCIPLVNGSCALSVQKNNLIPHLEGQLYIPFKLNTGKHLLVMS
jgi:hypothetical protein